jgi:hypothetical protein
MRSTKICPKFITASFMKDRAAMMAAALCAMMATACSTPPRIVGSLGDFEIIDNRSALEVRSRTGEVGLSGFAQTRFIGVWQAGGWRVAALIGRTDACAMAYALIAQAPDKPPNLLPLDACGTELGFSGDGTTLMVAEAGHASRHRIWRFADGDLRILPRPKPVAIAFRRVSARSDGATEADTPPSISQEVGAEVIPTEVTPSAAPPAPTVLRVQ